MKNGASRVKKLIRGEIKYEWSGSPGQPRLALAARATYFDASQEDAAALRPGILRILDATGSRVDIVYLLTWRVYDVVCLVGGWRIWWISFALGWGLINFESVISG